MRVVEKMIKLLKLFFFSFYLNYGQKLNNKIAGQYLMTKCKGMGEIL